MHEKRGYMGYGWDIGFKIILRKVISNGDSKNNKVFSRRSSIIFENRG